MIKEKGSVVDLEGRRRALEGTHQTTPTIFSMKNQITDAGGERKGEICTFYCLYFCKVWNFQ
jgi:hypothetical protein